MKSHIDPDVRQQAETFRAAAAMLMGAADAAGRPWDLLARLGYLDGTTEGARHRAALLRAASSFQRIFALESADAPGLIVLGAEVDPSLIDVQGASLGSVAGAGLTFREAFEACVGEGVEYLSQHAAAEDIIERLTADDALADATPALRALWEQLLPFCRNHATALTAWTIAADLANGQPVHLPADICVRRPADMRDIDPPWPLSVGCGAGPNPLVATLHGLLELIERDAVALWWRGGKPARLVPGDAGMALLNRLRGGNPMQRRTWLLDITSDIGVPVVVAASCHDNGFGLCCGFAARPTLAGAADAAVKEMTQMELAYRLAAMKCSMRGDTALNDMDRQHVLRFTTMDVAHTPALQPTAPPLPPHDIPANNDLAVLAALRKKLQAVGLAPCAINLTRAVFGIPVARVACPGLEMGMIAPPGPRLRAAATQSGADPTAAIPL
jgi:ribosomal protein S12 methylthiotransferase accessory factor